MKAFVFALTLFGLSSSAFASHPHDRVCVGQAAVAGGNSIPVLVQWQIGRTYDKGNGSEDNHAVTIEISKCTGDYADAKCVKAMSPIAKYAPSELKTVPAVLTDENGQLFFDGKFTLGTETLEGKMTVEAGKVVSTTIKLNCVSHPIIKFEKSEDSI